MTKTITNLLLMLITIVAGTYFFITYCSECDKTKTTEAPAVEAILKKADTTLYSFSFQSTDLLYVTQGNHHINSIMLMPFNSPRTTDISKTPDFPEFNEMNYSKKTRSNKGRKENNN